MEGFFLGFVVVVDGDGEYFFVVVSVVVVGSSSDLGFVFFFFFWWVCGYGYLIGRLNKKVRLIYKYRSHKKSRKIE